MTIITPERVKELRICVKELRIDAFYDDDLFGWHNEIVAVCDSHEALRAERDRYREALERIAARSGTGGWPILMDSAYAMASAALAKETK